LDPDGAKQWLAAWKGRIDEMAASAKAMSDRMQDLRVSAADPNGMVEVTVDTTGALVDLRLGPRIQRVAPEEVARTVMDTIAEAKGVLADRAQEIIAETMGADSEAGREIVARLEQQLRGPDGEGTDTSTPQGWR
jgi:DNA-binding protein YbaB